MAEVGEKNVFVLEALEPRVLLSGEGLLDDVAAGLDGLARAASQVEVAAAFTQPLPVLGQSLSDIYSPTAQLESIFGSLSAADLSSPESLATALQAQPGVSATVAGSRHGRTVLEITATRTLDATVPIQVTGDGTGDEELLLAGEAQLAGQATLELRVLAGALLHGDGFALDTAHSGLVVSLALDEPQTMGGTLGGTAITAAVSPLQLQATYEVSFTAPGGGDLLTAEQLSALPLTDFTHTNLTGHAALTAQLVETQRAPNAPPLLAREWPDLGTILQSGDRSGVAADVAATRLSGGDDLAASALVNQAITSDSGVQQMPSLALDPLDARHIAIAYMDYALPTADTGLPGEGYAGIGVAVSCNAGGTWQYSSIALPTGFDQGAATLIAKFDGEGRLYVSFMAVTFLGEPGSLTNPDFGNRTLGMQANNGVFVARSDDGGVTWGAPVAVVSHLYNGTDWVPFEAVPDLAIDTSAQLPDGSPNPAYGSLYVTWTRCYPAGQYPGQPDATGGTDVMLAVSGDRGATWATRLQDQGGLAVSTIRDPAMSHGYCATGTGYVDQSRLAVGPDGDLYESNFGGYDFTVYHSADGGVSFAGPTHADPEYLPFGQGYLGAMSFSGFGGNLFRTWQTRSIVADPTRPGTVYACEAVYTGTDPADVVFARSTDYGVTWDEPLVYSSLHGRILNDDNGSETATGAGAGEVISGQLLVRMAVDAQGNLVVIWYDTRRDPVDHLLDVWTTVSTDGGQTFSPNSRLTDTSFDASEGAFINARGAEEYYIGDLLGLAVADGTAYAAWNDTRAGNQDIVFCSFSVTPPPAAPSDRFEPNDTVGTATDLGRVVQRLEPRLGAAAGDNDWFLVESAASGELIATVRFDDPAQLAAAGVGLELWDRTGTTRLALGSALVGEGGTVLGQQLRCPSQASESYLVHVTGPAAAGAGTVRYALGVQCLTADLGVRAYAFVNGRVEGGSALYLVTAAAAGSLQVRLTNGADVQGDLYLQVLDPATFNVLATGRAPGWLDLTAISSEPDDAIGQALDTGLYRPGTAMVGGAIGDGAYSTTTGDFDFVSCQVDANQRISVSLGLRALGSGLDGMIVLYDSAGNVLAAADAYGPGRDESLAFTTTQSGTYFVAVLAWDSFAPDPFTPGTGAGAGSTGPYALTVTVETVEPGGPGAVELAALPVGQGDAVLLLVGGEGASIGDFALELANLDQFTAPGDNAVILPAGAGASAVAVADFNQDGILDLAVPDTFANVVAVLLGNGNGTFQAGRVFPVGAFPTEASGVFYQGLPNEGRPCAAGDLNGDGFADLVVANYSSADVSVLLGRGDGTFESQRRFDAGSSPHALLLVDLNRDGRLDIVTADASPGADNAVAALLGRGDGTFEPQRTTPVETGGEYAPALMATADFNEDGCPDLALGGRNLPGVAILLGNGDGTFRDGGTVAQYGGASGDVAAADLNHDGHADLVVLIYHAGSSENTFVALGRGDGSFAPEVLHLASDGSHPSGVAVGDVASQVQAADGTFILGPPDGLPDLVIANNDFAFGFSQGLPACVSVLPGLADGAGGFAGFGAAQRLALATMPMVPRIVDVTGDGVPEILAVVRDGVQVIFTQPPDTVPNSTPATARDLGAAVHLVDVTQTIVPGHEDAYYRLTAPTEALAGAGDEVLDLSGRFQCAEGAGLQMELLDGAGNVLASGERFRVAVPQGAELLLHVFGVADGEGGRGSGAFTLVLDVLPQVVSVEAQALLPGVGGQPGGPTTSLVVTFQGDRLDPTTAEDPTHYTVTWLGADGVAGTADDRVIAVGGTGIVQPVVYNPGANVEPSSGLTYPTAVRQTVTLLFAGALPAGSYLVSLSPEVQAAPYNEAEAGLLAGATGFSGHPVASLAGGSAVVEGSRVTTAGLVTAAGQLGGFEVFESGTPFLTQFHDDMGALLDSLLTQLGDAATIPQALLDQVVARIAPALGTQPARMLVLILDPVEFSLVDPDGRRVVYERETDTVLSQIPNTFVEVGGNVEVVVFAGAAWSYELEVAQVPARARGLAVAFTAGGRQEWALTSALREGVTTFSFTLGAPPDPVTPEAVVPTAPAYSWLHNLYDSPLPQWRPASGTTAPGDTTAPASSERAVAMLAGLPAGAGPAAAGTAGEAAAAEQTYRQAIARLEALVRESPGTAEYRAALGRCYYDLGVLLVKLGRTAAAEQAFRQAIARLEALLTESPDAAQYRAALGRCYQQLSLVLARQGRTAEAEQALRRADELLKTLAGTGRGVPGGLADGSVATPGGLAARLVIPASGGGRERARVHDTGTRPGFL